MISKMRTLFVSVALVGLLAGCDRPPANPADAIYVNGKIYTGNAAQPWAEAIATKGGSIQAVGNSADIQKLKGEASTVVDLGGRTVLPGLIDSHTHSLFGSMALHGLNLSTTESSLWADEKPDEFVAALQKYAAEHPNDKIIFARANMDPANGPTHELLDRAIPDRPLVIHNVNEHAMWVNKKTLELAGITDKPVADPVEESGIFRGPKGVPTGYIREASMEVVERPVLAALSDDEKLAMLRLGMKFLNQNGITAVVNATGNLKEIQLYGKLRDNNELTLRTRTSFGAIAAPHQLTPEFLADIETARKTYNDDWVSANLIKFFTDGSGGWGPIYETDQLANIMTELDKQGFQIMTHALGYNTAKQVLAAYQLVEKANGPRDRRWRMEHGGQVDVADIAEFSRLGVIASLQPAFCCGETKPGAQPGNPWQSLIKGNVKVIFSSDWPCSWPAEPLFGMGQAATRDIWAGRGYGAGMAGRTRTGAQDHPEEAVTVEQAVNAYTKDAAYAAFWDGKIGTLETGKLADFVVLTQDIFSVPVNQVANTKVATTILGGKTVYQAP